MKRASASASARARSKVPRSGFGKRARQGGRGVRAGETPRDMAWLLAALAKRAVARVEASGIEPSPMPLGRYFAAVPNSIDFATIFSFLSLSCSVTAVITTRMLVLISVALAATLSRTTLVSGLR